MPLSHVLRAFPAASRRKLFRWFRLLLQRASQAHSTPTQVAVPMLHSRAARVDSPIEVVLDPSLVQEAHRAGRTSSQVLGATPESKTCSVVLKVSSLHPRARSGATRHRGRHESFSCEGLAYVLGPSETLRASHDTETRDLIQGEFLRRMSHELRTPLHVIAGIGDLLVEHEEQESRPQGTSVTRPQRLLLEQLSRATKQMEELVGHLLDFSYMKTAHIAPLLQPFDLSEVLLLCWQHYFQRAEDKRVALTLESNIPEGFNAIGDARLLSQLIEHQLSNALKFTDSGRIVLSAHISEHDKTHFMLRLVVKDTGVGISEDDAERIFNAFEQAQSGDRRSSGGAGLGLFLCHHLAKALGSHLTIERENGFATCFATNLILGKPHSERQTLTTETTPVTEFINQVKDQIHGAMGAEPKTQHVPTTALPLRLLAVDDNEVNLHILRAMLAPYPCSVTCARDGLEAVREYASAPFDVILMDLQMPNMDGFEAVRQIRMLERAFGKSRALVTAISASCFSEDVIRARRAGCDDHVAKPVHRRALLETLHRHGFRLDPRLTPPATSTECITES